MRKKSVVSEAREIQASIEMIGLGARLQLLESETSLSRAARARPAGARHPAAQALQGIERRFPS